MIIDPSMIHGYVHLEMKIGVLFCLYKSHNNIIFVSGQTGQSHVGALCDIGVSIWFSLARQYISRIAINLTLNPFLACKVSRSIYRS